MSPKERAQIVEAIRGLMLSDNLGDVHEGIDVLRKAIGLKPLTGSFLSGWKEADWLGVDDEG